MTHALRRPFPTFLLLALSAIHLPAAATAGEPDVSDKARAEGFEDRVEAEREDHVREAVETARKRLTPTPAATPGK